MTKSRKTGRTKSPGGGRRNSPTIKSGRKRLVGLQKQRNEKKKTMLEKKMELRDAGFLCDEDDSSDVEYVGSNSDSESKSDSEVKVVAIMSPRRNQANSNSDQDNSSRKEPEDNPGITIDDVAEMEELMPVSNQRQSVRVKPSAFISGRRFLCPIVPAIKQELVVVEPLPDASQRDSLSRQNSTESSASNAEQRNRVASADRDTAVNAEPSNHNSAVKADDPVSGSHADPVASMSSQTGDEVVKTEDVDSHANRRSKSCTAPVWTMIRANPMHVIKKRILTVRERRRRILSHEEPIELGKADSFYHSKIYFKVDATTDMFVHDFHEPDRGFYDGEQNASLYIANHFDCNRHEISFANHYNDILKGLNHECTRQLARHASQRHTGRNEVSVTDYHWTQRYFVITLKDIWRSKHSFEIFKITVRYNPSTKELFVEEDNQFQERTIEKITNLAHVYLEEPIQKTSPSYLNNFDNYH